MSGKLSDKIDPYRRLRFNNLDPLVFEGFFLHFLNAGVDLTVTHHGRQVTRKIISASTYASGSGRKQSGIDLKAEVEGGEVWVFQCKRVQKWSASETKEAIEKAGQFQAHHYFLVVACDPQQPVYDEIAKHGNWTLWNLDRICEQFRLQVPPHKQPKCLYFLDADELKEFVPFSTRALISPDEFFESFLNPSSPFRHTWPLVGREVQLASLYKFLATPHQVLMLSAKGGDGKSRLLREFCRELPNRFPDSEVFFLNPQHPHDNPEFALLSPASPKVIIVDDAHRTENIPTSLLHLVRETKAKLVLATRPQGVEPLRLKLFDAGFQDTVTLQTLPALKPADALALAQQALVDAPEEQVKTLAQQTQDSPFLTVIAGDLIGRGKLKWPGDVSAEVFRWEVFRAFETDNLRLIPDVDRSRWRNLLRLIALLAPVEDSPGFAEKAAGCLGCSVVDIEDQLSRLRATELVVGYPNKLRVVPDLFADFLVYDACFEPAAAKPRFVHQVVQIFSDQSPAMLRNLAEAAWIARLNGVADPQFLGIVLAAEFQRFEAASFFQRSRTVEHWTRFGVFLPAESLDLARRAIALKTAAPDKSSEVSAWKETRLDTYSYVLQHLPPLLKPVALFHDAHRRAALDVLWELSLTFDWKEQTNNQNHPWAAIADMLKLEPEKPIAVMLSVLDWLVEKVRQPEVLKALEDPMPVLRTLLTPCFAYLVESTWAEGRTIHFRTAVASLPNTQPIRDRALAVIRHVIEHGTWLAALDALSALETGYCRIARFHEDKVESLDKFRLEWRPERLKALGLLKEMLARHEHKAVRYSVRQSLKMLVAYEEDSVVQDEARGILKSIRDDLDLRVAKALLSHGLEGDDERTKRPQSAEEYQQAQIRWHQVVVQVARELAANHPEPRALLGYLDQQVTDLLRAGESPHFHSLYPGLVQAAPRLAADLAREILVASSPTYLATNWTLLLMGNPMTDPQQRLGLFNAAADSSNSKAKESLVDHVSWRLRSNDDPLSESEKALTEKLAASADAGLAVRFLQLVRWAIDPHREWAWILLFRLPLQPVAKKDPDELIEVLCNPRDDNAVPPGNVVRHVLAQLVAAPRLNFREDRESWSRLKQEYSKEIYDLVVSRIERDTESGSLDGYNPIPDGWPSNSCLSGLQTHPDYKVICDELWGRVTSPAQPKRYHWVELFKSVVLQDPGNWLPRLNEFVQACPSAEELSALVRLVCFDGSLVIFRQPEFTRRVLQRAESLGDQAIKEALRCSLYHTAGPQGRSYTNGKLDEDSDYVEAAAIKAAEAHAEDPILGPFYRWIVEVEQRNRTMHRVRFEVESIANDD